MSAPVISAIFSATPLVVPVAEKYITIVSLPDPLLSGVLCACELSCADVSAAELSVFVSELEVPVFELSALLLESPQAVNISIEAASIVKSIFFSFIFSPPVY